LSGYCRNQDAARLAARRKLDAQRRHAGRRQIQRCAIGNRTQQRESRMLASREEPAGGIGRDPAAVVAQTTRLDGSAFQNEPGFEE